MVKAIDDYTTDGYITIKELTSSRSAFKCATCDNNITELRAMKFPICDECMKDLSRIISERRKPKVG
ncbi:hypothetical protein SAMN05720471_12433 [Fibrobacter sp. UWP2]|nr:hypothetical protein SAMN05720471_12433 [Fibrobacter sp. UWP2]